MITLPNFLKSCSRELKTEFDPLPNEEKDVLLAGHQEAKNEKENIPMTPRALNTAISKAVDAKMKCITAMVLYVHITVLILF
jgi:hypothetical protein